jgi:hypothetical protein
VVLVLVLFVVVGYPTNKHGIPAQLGLVSARSAAGELG